MTTTAVGLSSLEAAARLQRLGPNRPPPPRRMSWRRRLLQQLRDPLIVVLLVAAVLTVATGDHPDAVIIAIVILANTAVGLAQEIKADNAIAALRTVTAPDARVIRDGALTAVDTETVVPGDAVVVGEGDIVPADAVLIESAALLVDASTLTGESIPVEKDVTDGPAGELAAGTVVVHGRGVAIVTRTGADSAMGVIAAALAAPPALTPLQRRLADLGLLLLPRPGDGNASR